MRVVRLGEAARAGSPWLLDGLLCSGLLGLALVLLAEGTVEWDEGTGAVALASAVLACAPVALRRRFPAPAALVSLSGCVMAGAVSAFQAPLQLALAVLLYTTASRSGRGVRAAVGTGAVVTLIATDLAWGAVLFSPSVLWWPMSVAAAMSVGYSVRVHRERLADSQDRARRAEEQREEEARRRVAEERLRIARELHDVVAHNLTLVSVQAEVAAHLLRSDPDAAEQALDHVRRGSRSVLSEMSALLSVVRADGEEDPTAPAPGLDQFPELLRTFTEAGFEVDYRVSGSPLPLGPGTGLVAYRLLQEALTNAHKHGAGTATVRLAYGAARLSLEVRNPLHPGGTAPSPSGLGTIGMRERVTAIGGTLETGQVEDGYRVYAAVPLENGGNS